MFRRRNGRNKGLKIKHVLQISLLLGVSVWLLYQVHNSDDKKSSIATNIINNLQNDGSKVLFKLGRKDLRPKVKETQDRKETEEHQVDEEGNENEVEEFVHDEDGEDMKHEQVEENENTDDGEEHDEEAEDKENGDNGNSVKNENIQKQDTKSEDGVVVNKENRSKRSEEVNKRNETKENKKENLVLRSNEGRKKELHKTNGNDGEMERKDAKQIDDREVNENKSNEQNKVKVVVMGKADEMDGVKRMNSSMKVPLTNHGQSESQKGEDVNHNNNHHGHGPSNNISQPALDASTNATSLFEKETNAVSTIQFVNSGNENTISPDSYSKVDTQVDEQESKLNNQEIESSSILEEEKEVLTDLETLPDSGIGASITHENAVTG